MSSQKVSGLVSKAVREALSTLMSPQLCEQLISRALATRGLADVPETGLEIGKWIEGPLRAEVETAVGPDAAELMMAQLGPIAAYAAVSVPASNPRSGVAPRGNTRESAPDDDEAIWSMPTQAPPPSTPNAGALASSPFSSEPPTGVLPRVGDANSGSTRSSSPRFSVKRPSSEARQSTKPPPAASASEPADIPTQLPPERLAYLDESEGERTGTDPAQLPFVLVASRSMASLSAITHCLSDQARVLQIPDLVGLLDALDDPQAVEPVVVLDCHEPTVHVGSVAAIGQDLPRGTTVVLWGATDLMWQQIDRERSPSCRWVRCSSEAIAADVGSLCSMLLG